MSDLSDAELFARRDEEDARAELVSRYDYLAQQLARKFRGRGASPDDLLQVARFGLVGAIDRFDVDRGVKFSTFAGRTIVGEIKHHFRATAWSVRVPRSLQNLWLRASEAVQVLSQRFGRSPTIPELAEYLDVDEEEVVEALEAGEGLQADSLDRPIGGDSARPMGAMLGSDDRRIERAALLADVSPIVESLDEREQTILFMRFFEGRTQQEIADEIGISQVHVSRLLRQTMSRIRGEVASG